MLSLGYMTDDDAREAELGEAALQGLGLGSIGNEGKDAMERACGRGNNGVGVMRQEAALKSGGAGWIIEGAELNSEGSGDLRGWRRNDREADGANAGTDEGDLFRSALGKINDAALDEGATIGDADLSTLAVGLVENIDPGIEGKAEMSSGEGAHVIDLTIGGAAAMIGFAIPTGEATLGVTGLNVDKGRGKVGDRTAPAARNAQDEREAHKYRGAERLEHRRKT
jgi:hypothetical protein